MSAYRVPVATDGRRRTVTVEAADEWGAQSAAAALIRNRPVTKAQPRAGLIEISHAIPVDLRECTYGCCTLPPVRRQGQG